MKLSDLHTNQIVTFRIGRAGKSNVIWGEWQQGYIYVARRLTSLPNKLKTRTNAPNVGDIITICPKDIVCAEFSQGDYFPEFHCFNCEDWYFEIKELI